MPSGGASGAGGSVSAGNLHNAVGVAMGTNARVDIKGPVTINNAPLVLSAPLRGAFAPMLEDRTALFGGRQAVFDRIGEFVRGPGGFLVITAPAGFGKTSVMASLVSAAPEAFAYHFFTPSYDGDLLSEDFFLHNVVEQLAAWHGRKGNLPEQPRRLRGLYQELIAEPLEATQVLVLDGLDEVPGWSLKPYLSRRLPERMHVIATVRDVGQDWRREYGFPPEQTKSLSLEGLERAEVIEVLEAAGGPARALASDPAALDDVVRVAAFPNVPELGADPFYVRLLAEDAAQRQLDPASLAERPAGLEGYLDEWWQEIDRAAGDEATSDLFGMLAAALGPISRADLEHVNPSLRGAWATDVFDKVLRRVRRLVVADEHGYSLVHPRLREYVSGRLELAPYEDRLLSLCRDWRDHRSEYALTHGAYTLREAQELTALVGLVSRDWMGARLSQTGSHAAFAEDVALAHAAVLEAEPRDVVQAIRLSHVHATLGSFATQVPPAALAILARVGRAAPALRQAAMIQDAKTRVSAYRMIAEALLEDGDVAGARAALARGLAATDAVHHDRGAALAELAPAFAATTQFETLARRLDARSLPTAAYRLAQASDASAGRAGLQEIADIAAAVDDERRFYLLGLVCEGWMMLGASERARGLVPVLKDLGARFAERDGGALALLAPARALARAGARATATEWAGRARPGIDGRLSAIDRVYVAEQIAEVYARAGDYEEALDVACAELKDLRSGRALLRLVHVAAEAGEPAAVLSHVKTAAARAAGIESLGDSARCDVAVALAQAGAPDEARELAASIRNERSTAAAHQQLARWFAEQRRFDEAQTLADAVADDAARAEAQRDIVRALAYAGQGERAIALADEIEVPTRAAEAYAAAAEEALRGGNPSRAAELADRALEATLVLTARADLVPALCAVARRLAEQDRGRGQALIATAIESAELDPRPGYSVQALTTVGETLTALRDGDRARDVFQRASRLVLTMTADLLRDSAITDLLKARAEAGALPSGEARPLIEAIVDGDWRASALLKVATALNARGDPSAAEFHRLVLDANTGRDRPAATRETPADANAAEPSEAEPAEDSWAARDRRRWELAERVNELAALASELATAGDAHAAYRAAREAVACARAIEIDDWAKSEALEQAARMLAGTGDLSGAIDVLDELPEWPRATSFNRLAATYLEIGQPDRALGVWLRGFADLERSTRGVVFGALEATPSVIAEDELLWQLCQAVIEVEHWWDPRVA